ncbi:calponin-likey domain-containing protein [Quillaja saponaria]|uniref:Calponin-likey domain-containing protein n=1 Tax=Quillaja saponaria TaxID=32244 RepID=A0AAD7KW03_QUISA|nr:calponin-likey domain-containing protein [Quillaja saponaria]
MAARQAAMEARRAAFVEASWISIKDVEAELLKAEKAAAEAFEAALAMGESNQDVSGNLSIRYLKRVALALRTWILKSLWR